MSAVQWVTIGAAVAAGVSSGTTYAFSSFVMRGLDRLPQVDAIRAMQSINEAAIHPAFLGVFIGTGPALIALSAWRSLLDRPDGLVLVATGIYVVGVIGVTVLGNVPMNEALGRVVALDAPSGVWAKYSGPWTGLNHLRTLAAAVSAALLIASVAR